MADFGVPFPTRPLKVSPPASGILAVLGGVLLALFITAGCLLIVIPPIPDIVTDFGLRAAARPLAGTRIEEGRCTVHVAVMTECEATLLLSRKAKPELERKVAYWFLDFHTGDYTVAVVADPSRPGQMTTDLGLDKLWNRTLTLLLLGPLFLLLAVFSVKFFVFGAVRDRRAVVRALTNQVLRPVILHLDTWGKGAWTVSSLTPTGARKSCEWKTKGTPITMDASQGLVLGVTAGDGTMCMPLDTKLAWIDLTDAERAHLLQVIGPERLRGGA